MSFLDSLENNLRALESRDEAEAERRPKANRDAQRNEAALIAPHADALREGPFTSGLLSACRVVGHSMRTLVRFTWLDSTLRLDAKERRLELRPTPEGVRAFYFEDGVEQSSQLVDLKSDPAKFARQWLEAPGQG